MVDPFSVELNIVIILAESIKILPQVDAALRYKERKKTFFCYKWVNNFNYLASCENSNFCILSQIVRFFLLGLEARKTLKKIWLNFFNVV